MKKTERERKREREGEKKPWHKLQSLFLPSKTALKNYVMYHLGTFKTLNEWSKRFFILNKMFTQKMNNHKSEKVALL